MTLCKTKLSSCIFLICCLTLQVPGAKARDQGKTYAPQIQHQQELSKLGVPLQITLTFREEEP